MVMENFKNTFKSKFDTSGTPKEIYNRHLWYCLLIFGVFGSFRGYDEGYISAVTTQKSFKALFKTEDPTKSEVYLDNLVSNIKAMVQLGSIGGSLLGGYTNDKLGRIRALQQVCFFWMVFAVIQITARSVGQLYAGRLLEGLAIGQTTVIGPTYLSEVAPKRIRGLANGLFSGAVYFGIMMGYFVNLGTAVHVADDNNAQWMIPTSLKLIFPALVGFGSIWCLESPRWLIKVGKNKEALKALCRLRKLPESHPYVLGELNDVYELLNLEIEAVRGTSTLTIFKELIFQKANRYRFLLCLSSQMLSQWSGANALTVYTSTIFELLGIEGQINKFVYTAILGVVKFCAAYLCAFLLIDALGRRRSLYTGMTIQFISLLYVGCFLKVYPADRAGEPTANELRASRAGMALIYISGVGWAMGWNSIQYLLGSEIFPLRLRSVATSLTMCFHFLNQYGNSKALPSLLRAMDDWGCFIFFCGVLALGMFWAWFFLPEVSNRSLESMEDLFNLPWYLIGRRGNKLAPDHSTIDAITRNQVKDVDDFTAEDWEQKGGHVDYLENGESIEKDSIRNNDKDSIQNVEKDSIHNIEKN